MAPGCRYFYNNIKIHKTNSFAVKKMKQITANIFQPGWTVAKLGEICVRALLLYLKSLSKGCKNKIFRLFLIFIPVKGFLKLDKTEKCFEN